MKKIAIIASLFCLGALSSCELKDELTGPKGENSEMGALELTVSVSESAAQSRANSEAPGNYPVVIVNKDTEEEAYNGTYEEMKKPLSLPVGTYTVNSHTPGDIKTSMTSPYYGGEKEMTITKGVVSVLDMVCKMLNTKIALKLGDDFKAAFKEWTINLNDGSGHVLTFTKADVENNVVYWYFGDNAHVSTLTMDITATTQDGVKIRDQKQFTKADAEESYEDDSDEFTGGDALNINIGAIEEPTPEPGEKPQLGFNVSVDITFDGRDETVEIPVVDVPTTDPEPGEPDEPGDEKLPTIEKQDVTFSHGNVPGDAMIKINTPAGLKSMNVKIVAGNEDFGGVVGDLEGLDFVNSGVEMVENEGITQILQVFGGEELAAPQSGVLSYDFPMYAFLGLMDGFGVTAPKSHVFQVVVEDMNGNKVSDEVKVTINE